MLNIAKFGTLFLDSKLVDDVNIRLGGDGPELIGFPTVASKGLCDAKCALARAAPEAVAMFVAVATTADGGVTFKAEGSC